MKTSSLKLIILNSNNSEMLKYYLVPIFRSHCVFTNGGRCWWLLCLMGSSVAECPPDSWLHFAHFVIYLLDYWPPSSPAQWMNHNNGQFCLNKICLFKVSTEVKTVRKTFYICIKVLVTVFISIACPNSKRSVKTIVFKRNTWTDSYYETIYTFIYKRSRRHESLYRYGFSKLKSVGKNNFRYERHLNWFIIRNYLHLHLQDETTVSISMATQSLNQSVKRISFKRNTWTDS